MPDRISRRRFLAAAGALLAAPAHAQGGRRPERASLASALPWSGTELENFRLSTPEAQGIDSARLAAMTRFIESTPQRVFSMLIARNGTLVYEMLAGDLSRNTSHYLMSVTKSLTSALAGIAIDRGIILSEDQPIGDLLPAELFGSAENLRDKAGITVRQVLNMSALDVRHIVGNTDPRVRAIYSGWVNAKNRVRYALAQPRVQRPMREMDYTDLDCSLINGVIHYRTGKTVFDFANEVLFSRMDFRNQEWMGQDSYGIDLGGYGVRLRPIDMLKFGQLYLQRGIWNGKALLSAGWVDKAYVSQIAPRRDHLRYYSGYSNFWWHGRHRSSPKNIMANGWKGQRISIFPELGLVVTLTGVIEGDSSELYDHLIADVLYSVRDGSLRDNVASFDELQLALRRMRKKGLRLESVEPRMRPEEKNKGRRIPWRA
jgi:CubicO group peptidase (beta-lactamase class C family)